MANDLTTSRGGGYLASTEDYYAALAQEAMGLKGGGAGKAFMKFNGNDGEFSYGADDEDLPLGSKLAVNMRSYQRGWVIWVDGEVVHEDMQPLGTPQPTKHGLPDYGPYGEDDGPVEQYTIDFKTLDEPYVEMVFQANNSSKRRALAALLKDFGNLYKAHPGEVPIIELDEREFETKTKGGKGRKITKHAPVFKIVGWMPEEELAALAGDDPGDYQDDEPPARGRGRDREEEPRSRRSARDEDDAPRSRRTSRDGDPAPDRDRDRDRDEEPRSRRPAREEEDEAPRRRPAREEEDEAPRSRRPAREEEDEAPRSRRPAREEEDEPAPARRPARDEQDDEPAPARRASRPAAEDDADAPPRRSGRTSARDEDEDAPRSRRPVREEEPAATEATGSGRRRGRY